MCCEKGDYCKRQVYIIDVEKAVLPQRCIFQTGGLRMYDTTINLIFTGNINECSKYINTKYRFIYDHNKSSHILTLYIPTDQQPVDSFTKPLSLVKFSVFVSGLDLMWMTVHWVDVLHIYSYLP